MWFPRNGKGREMKEYQGNSFSAPQFTATIANMLLCGVKPAEVKSVLKKRAANYIF